MQFVYHKLASEKMLKIDGELSKYIFKVRRYDSAIPIYFRNLKDDNLYKYKVENITRRDATLSLVDFETKIIKPTKYLHIGWCIIDTKSIEKQIASLNEMGVSKITFIYCSYSQNKYKPNFEKLDKLLINSSQQCGRSDIIKLDSCNSLSDFSNNYPNSYMFNFSNNHISQYKNEIVTT
jgi:16S rRNA (uracil1498-N3)-methyltransferase